MSCSTIISGIPLDCCVYNASGPRTGSVEALLKIGESKSGAVLSKSATLIKQDGNPLPRFVNKVALGDKYCEGSINSEGLPNFGIDYCEYEDALHFILHLILILNAWHNRYRSRTCFPSSCYG
jgi:dihydroorotate dehydrogenase